MNIVTKPGKPSVDIQCKPVNSEKRWLWQWRSSWEFYVIVLISAFLRLYAINTTEFDGDQADIFQMAHNAVSHGLLVATSNIASIGIVNPPAIVYLLMLPAAFSANPLWGAAFTAILAIAGVILTYLFTRHYYGRLAAAIATSLFGVASFPVFYSRFMWNQNMLPFFVPLFFCFLFRGAVDKRRIWLFPAVLLFALLVQFHASTIVLIASLVVAILLAPRRSIRWYDLLIILVGLFLLYAPYYLWLAYTNFRDIAILLASAEKPKNFSPDALFLYQSFLGVLGNPLTNPSSVMYQLSGMFEWLRDVMTALLIGAVLSALVIILRSHSMVRRHNLLSTAIASVWKWVQDLRTSSSRCGLLLLLTWQIVPLFYLLRPSVKLGAHYFIVFMPGQYILIGIFLAKIIFWVRRYTGWGKIASAGISVVCVVLVLLEGLGALGYVIDSSTGNFVDTTWSEHYYSDLNSMQQVIRLADQQAYQRHASRIFIATDQPETHAFEYLASVNSIPTTVEDTTCLLIPGPQQGPAILITGPRSSASANMATTFAHANAIGVSPRLSGPPFHLYELNPLPQIGNGQATFGHAVQLLGVQSTGTDNGRGLISRWQFLQTEQASYRTRYYYQFADAQTTQGLDLATNTCTFSDVHAGDHVLVPLQKTASQQTQLAMRVATSATLSITLSYKVLGMISLPFSTFGLDNTPWRALPVTSGTASIRVVEK